MAAMPDHGAHETMSKGMVVSNVRANMALPSDTGSFWMDITNNTDTDDMLIGAEVAGCGAIELHEMAIENDVMLMQEVAGGEIPLPAGETVTLKKGGLHIMCIGKTEALEVDSTVHITVNFAHAESAHIMAPVVAPGEDMPKKHDG